MALNVALIKDAASPEQTPFWCGCIPGASPAMPAGSLRCDCRPRRLRPCARSKRKARGGRLSAPGRAGHRPDQQVEGLQPPGSGLGTVEANERRPRRICATTASAHRSSPTSASASCGCSPTTPARSPASAAILQVEERVPLVMDWCNADYLATGEGSGVFESEVCVWLALAVNVGPESWPPFARKWKPSPSAMASANQPCMNPAC